MKSRSLGATPTPSKSECLVNERLWALPWHESSPCRGLEVVQGAASPRGALWLRAVLPCDQGRLDFCGGPGDPSSAKAASRQRDTGLGLLGTPWPFLDAQVAPSRLEQTPWAAVGCAEKRVGVGAGLSLRGDAFRAGSPGQTSQNPFAPTVSPNVPFRGCQSAPAPGTAAAGSQQPGLSLRTRMGGGTPVFGVLGLGPQRGRRLEKDLG